MDPFTEVMRAYAAKAPPSRTLPEINPAAKIAMGDSFMGVPR